MKVLAINGSPRKGWNTEIVLKQALEGAARAGAETELLQLYDEPFKGCVSCFACKAKNVKKKGVCYHRDALSPILEKAREADVLIIGSPIYFDSVTAQTRAFMERFMFPVDMYMQDRENGGRLRAISKKTPCALIYTMNCPEDVMKSEDFAYPKMLSVNERNMNRVIGDCETLFVCDTYQFADYNKIDCDLFDPEYKKKQREQLFPVDCRKAYALGERLVGKAEQLAQNT